MGITYPEAWRGLTNPKERFELLGRLDELARPERTALWVSAKAAERAGGIRESLEFFFKDHQFDRDSIGGSLFDDRELVSIQMVKNGLDKIFRTNRRGDSRYFLKHRGWKMVQTAAQTAHQIMIANDVAKSG
jgi:hypothetical protein